MNIRPGALVYDKASGRYDIRFGLDEYYGGLHCGQCFEVFDGEQWRVIYCIPPTLCPVSQMVSGLSAIFCHRPRSPVCMLTLANPFVL